MKPPSSSTALALKLIATIAATLALVIGGVAIAEEVEWYVGTPSKTTKRVAGTDNPLPAGIYPKLGADVTVSCSAAATAKSAQLGVGRYIVQCGAFKAWIDQGATTVTAEMNADRLLLANGQMPFRVDDTTADGYLAVICTNSQICVISEDL